MRTYWLTALLFAVPCAAMGPPLPSVHVGHTLSPLAPVKVEMYLDLSKSAQIEPASPRSHMPCCADD